MSALLLICACVFIATIRQRLYLRDPLARVTRSGIMVPETRVFINYTNDVLLEDFSHSGHRVYLVQNWNRLPAVPGVLRCIVVTACLADADHALATPLRGAQSSKMSNAQVDFVDENSFPISVVLR